MANPFLSITTFTIFGSLNSPAVFIRTAGVEMEIPLSEIISLTQSSISSGGTRGSSPWTFTTISAEIFRDASATLSVPLPHAPEVNTAFPPNAETALKILSSSVATVTSSIKRDLLTLSYTHCIMGLPLIFARGFPGRGVDAKLGGVKAGNFISGQNIKYRKQVNVEGRFSGRTGEAYAGFPACL